MASTAAADALSRVTAPATVNIRTDESGSFHWLNVARDPQPTILQLLYSMNANQTVLRTLPVGLIVTDGQGRILEGNEPPLEEISVRRSTDKRESRT